MIRHMNKLEINLDELSTLIDINVENLKEMYPDLEKNKETIKSVILEEKDKFVKTLSHGEKEFTKAMNYAKQNGKNKIDGKIVFRLYDTYGFPPEMTQELAKENNIEIDLEEFNKLFKEHQEKSKAPRIRTKIQRWTSRPKRKNNSIPHCNTLATPSTKNSIRRTCKTKWIKHNRRKTTF